MKTPASSPRPSRVARGCLVQLARRVEQVGAPELRVHTRLGVEALDQAAAITATHARASREQLMLLEEAWSDGKITPTEYAQIRQQEEALASAIEQEEALR